MKVSIEKKKEEAVKRMRAMNVFGVYRKSFKESGRLQVSEPPYGALYYLDDVEDKELIDYIKEFENGGENLVYLVVRTWFVELGKIDSLFYVSDHEEEWAMDWEDMKDNIQVVNCYNWNDPWCSEIGSIMFTQTAAGGIRRIA